MPERRIDSVYNVKRVNVVFALSSLVLAAVSVQTIWEDYKRPWRKYQREFRRLDLDKTATAIKAEDEKLKAEHGKDLEAIQGQMDQAKAKVASAGAELAAAEAGVTKASDVNYLADQKFKFKKAWLDVVKYQAETADEEHSPDATKKKDALAATQKEWEDLKITAEKAAAELDAAKSKVTGILKDRDDAQKKLDDLTRDKARLETKVTKIGHNFANDYFRNFPGLDFISPSQKVQQIVVPTLLMDIGFETKVPKVERCTTCHLGIDREGWEDAPQPFRSHPRLTAPKDHPDARPDFLSAKSPHPIDTFACTVCHGGMPQAVEFQRADHYPPDKETEEKWEKEYGWHHDHFWDFPMKPKAHVEAGCLKCHRSEVDVPGAPDLSRGKHLFQKMGCFGCHNVAGLGFENLRKVGPDLRRVKAKDDPEWIYRWIRNPKAFRPSTRMPQIFDLKNTSTDADLKRSDTAIAAIVAYLMAKSEDFPLPSIPGGDAARGKELFEEVGCQGCHVAEIGKKNNAPRGFENFGPNLAGVGSKLKPEWIYAWVKDPKAYFPETRMPSLRLSDGEAADIAAYLSSLKLETTAGPIEGQTQAQVFDAIRKPALDEGELENMVVEQLHKLMTRDEAVAKAASMGKDEKLVYLGEKMIARQGCFACHMIGGFEKAQPIGTDLTDQGRKLVKRLDFGFHHEIPNTLHDFIFNKLKDPRIYDDGRLKEAAWEDKLKMPFFNFTDDEARDITTFVLGLTKEQILKERVKLLSPREIDIEAGRRIIRERNCQGCHVLEGQRGDIRAFYAEDKLGNAPPVLYREGSKVNSDWLYGFLKAPTPIRPWLKVRMPTFHFTDDEANVISRYFAAYDSEPYPFVTPDMEAPPAERLTKAGELFTQCMQCHVVGAPPPGKDPSQLAPNLLLAKKRLRAKWVAEWLKDPQKLQPGTRMPNFFYDEGNPLYPDADDQIQAVRHYVLNLDEATVLAQAKAAAAAAPPPSTTPAESYE